MRRKGSKQAVDKKLENNIDSRVTIYQELCNSYRAIDDFRAKLLGFLPLASGAGIFLLIDGDFSPETKTFLWAVGSFGFLVTLGLFFYELYGVKKCHALISAGKELEEDLGIDAQRGQFTARPREVAGLINEPLAAGVIYPAVLAAWTFVPLFFDSQDLRWWAIWWALGVFIVGFTVVLLFNLKLKMEEGLRIVLKIRKEDPVKIGHVREYFTSKDVEEDICKEMETKKPVKISHRWNYLHEVTIEGKHQRLGGYERRAGLRQYPYG